MVGGCGTFDVKDTVSWQTTAHRGALLRAPAPPTARTLAQPPRPRPPLPGQAQGRQAVPGGSYPSPAGPKRPHPLLPRLPSPASRRPAPAPAPAPPRLPRPASRRLLLPPLLLLLPPAHAAPTRPGSCACPRRAKTPRPPPPAPRLAKTPAPPPSLPQPAPRPPHLLALPLGARTPRARTSSPCSRRLLRQSVLPPS